jgi:hypothetical protein
MPSKLKDWDYYLDLLRPAGNLLRQTWKPDDPAYRADLYRQMVMSVAYAYFQYFQSNDEHPEFMPLWNSVFLLQPNPDDVYYYAPLDARRTYRILGERGTTHMVNFLFGHDMIGMADPPAGSTSYVDNKDLIVGPDGRFEFLLGTTRPAGFSGHWHQLDPRADHVVVRLRSYDWGNEIDTRMAIECIDAPPVKRRMPITEIHERLERALTLPERFSRLWFDSVVRLSERPAGPARQKPIRAARVHRHAGHARPAILDGDLRHRAGRGADPGNRAAGGPALLERSDERPVFQCGRVRLSPGKPERPFRAHRFRRTFPGGGLA